MTIDADAIADYLADMEGDLAVTVWQPGFHNPSDVLGWLDRLGLTAWTVRKRNSPPRRYLCVPLVEAVRCVRCATYVARSRDKDKCADPEPFAALMLSILRQAKSDAERGDLGALAWLITDGAPFAAQVMENGNDLVLEFARGIVARFPKGDLLHAWGLDADDAQLEFPL